MSDFDEASSFEELIVSRNADRLANANNPNKETHINISTQSEAIGSLIADAAIARRYPDQPPIEVPIFQTANQTGMFDSVKRVQVTGEERLLVVEEKGVGTTGPSYSQRRISDENFQQGHEKYFLDVVQEMVSRGGAEDLAAARAILEAAENGTLDYFVVIAQHLDDFERTNARFLRLELPDDIGEKLRLIVPEN